jgi:hypothetical protein
MTSRANVTRRAGDKLTVADVCADLGISRRLLDEWRAKGKAPQRIPLQGLAGFFPPSGSQEGVQLWRHFGYRLVEISRIFVCGVPMRAGALSLEDQTFARRKPRKLSASLVVSKSRSMTT